MCCTPKPSWIPLIWCWRFLASIYGNTDNFWKMNTLLQSPEISLMPRVRVGLGWWKDLQHPGQQHTSRHWRLRNHKRDQDACADGQISDIAQDLCWSLNKDYPGSMRHLFIPYSDSTTCPQHAFVLEYDWYLVAFFGGYFVAFSFVYEKSYTYLWMH